MDAADDNTEIGIAIKNRIAEEIEGADEGAESKGGGEMTWHVYAAHAQLELQQNGLPLVAARVYELGIARHKSFLMAPEFVQQYAQLLKTMGDEDNFRSLVQRALMAIEGDASVDQRPLWNMLLKFECEGAKTAGDLKAIKELELMRQKALGTEESAIPKALRDQLQKIEGGTVGGNLDRILMRVGIIVGGGCGGQSDEAFALRGFVEEETVASGTVDRQQLARERLDAMKAANQKKAPAWLQILLDRLGPVRGRRDPNRRTLDQAVANLLNYPLPEKPSEQEGKRRIAADPKEGGGGGEKRGRGEEESDEEDGEAAGFFAKRQRQKASEGQK